MVETQCRVVQLGTSPQRIETLQKGWVSYNLGAKKESALLILRLSPRCDLEPLEQ